MKQRSSYVWVMSTEYAPVILGGLGTVATELTRALIHSGMKINVITKNTSHSTRYKRYKRNAILRIPSNPFFYNRLLETYKPRMIQQTTARLFSGKPELIHVHSLEFAKAALLLKRQYRIPVVYTCHSLVSARSHSQMVRRKNQALLIRQADQITVPSYWLKNAIRKQHTGSASRITVIPHGVNAIIKGSRVRPYQLLFVGRLLPGKGIEALIRSVALLSVHNRQIRLTVIGKGSPKYQKHLRDLARKLGIQSRIRWLGFLPHRQVQRLYASHGALVVPSKLESFCLVALEAMANGIPLVSTRAGGLKEFVHDGNAQIIRSVNGKAIERAVQAMWRNPKRTRQRIIKAKVVAKRYSWRSAALQYKMLFSRLHRHIVNGRREEVGRAVVGKRV